MWLSRVSQIYGRVFLRIRLEWSPEQSATTTPRTTRPPKGFPPKAAAYCKKRNKKPG